MDLQALICKTYQDQILRLTFCARTEFDFNHWETFWVWTQRYHFGPNNGDNYRSQLVAKLRGLGLPTDRTSLHTLMDVKARPVSVGINHLHTVPRNRMYALPYFIWLLLYTPFYKANRAGWAREVVDGAVAIRGGPVRNHTTVARRPRSGPSSSRAIQPSLGRPIVKRGNRTSVRQ